MDEGNKPDNLDKLVNQAAEGAQFDFNAEAWSAMEAKLDGKSWWAGAWWKFGLPILLVGLLVILFWPGGPVDILNPKPNTTILSKEDQSPASNKNINPKPAQTGIEQEMDKSTAVDQPEVVQSEEPDADQLEKRIPRKVQKKVTVTNRLVTNKLKATENSAVAYYSNEVANENEIGALNSSNANSETLFGKAFLPTRVSYVRYGGPIEPWVLDSAFTKLGEIDSTFRRFTYGLVVSLDLSSTRLEGFTDPGTMVGLVGEYRLNKRWAVQSGIAYATKIYSALGSEYVTPDWALNAPNDFSEVLAKCLVIDIPINFKRYFTSEKGNQWFLAGGVSSYIMLREDYTYNYTPARPAWPNTWRYENQNQHYFGILNVSGGLVRPLTKKINVQIEPFMKIPMTGIGQGEVKFLSFGTNFSFVLK